MKDAALAAWARQPFALVHGEDGDGRKAAVAAWKAVHVDPEWADWSLTVCGEGCPWAEIQNALQEAPPMGAAARVVLAPAADNLFAKPKELPASLKGWLDKPPADLRLLLVAWGTLSTAPGKALGAKPWTDWTKAGRVLKTGVLEAEELDAFLAAEAKRLGLELGPRPKELLVQRLGVIPACCAGPWRCWTSSARTARPARPRWTRSPSGWRSRRPSPGPRPGSGGTPLAPSRPCGSPWRTATSPSCSWARPGGRWTGR